MYWRSVYTCTARLFSTHATPLQRYGTDMAQNGICKTPASVVNRAAQGQMQSKKGKFPIQKGLGGLWMALGAQNLTVRKCMMRSCTARLFSTHATPLQRYGTDMAQNGICKTPASVVNRAAQGQMQSKKGKFPIHFWKGRHLECELHTVWVSKKPDA